MQDAAVSSKYDGLDPAEVSVRAATSCFVGRVVRQLPFVPLGHPRCSPVPQGSRSDRKAAREAREAREADGEGRGTAQTPNARTTAKPAKPAERISVYQFCRDNPTWCVRGPRHAR